MRLANIFTDQLAAETAAYMTVRHPLVVSPVIAVKPVQADLLLLFLSDYAVLAARIAISNLHKETKKTFSHVIHDLFSYGQSSDSLSPIFEPFLMSIFSSQPKK